MMLTTKKRQPTKYVYVRWVFVYRFIMLFSSSSFFFCILKETPTNNAGLVDVFFCFLFFGSLLTFFWFSDVGNIELFESQHN